MQFEGRVKEVMPVQSGTSQKTGEPWKNQQFVFGFYESSDAIYEREVILKLRNDKVDLYKLQVGREYCPWSEDYPSEETIDYDLSRDALFVMKANGKIISAISIEKDEDVDALPCWGRDTEPAGELARLAVLPEEQNQGIGKIMLQFGMGELKRRGFRGIRFLVGKYNKKAISCYSGFGFQIVGKCHIYEQDFLCYEKEL